MSKKRIAIVFLLHLILTYCFYRMYFDNEMALMYSKEPVEPQLADILIEYTAKTLMSPVYLIMEFGIKIKEGYIAFAWLLLVFNSFLWSIIIELLYKKLWKNRNK